MPFDPTVAQLREKGHSHQRIADAVGTHKSTVQADLKADAPGGGNPLPGDQPGDCAWDSGSTPLVDLVSQGVTPGHHLARYLAMRASI